MKQSLWGEAREESGIQTRTVKLTLPSLAGGINLSHCGKTLCLGMLFGSPVVGPINYKLQITFKEDILVERLKNSNLIHKLGITIEILITLVRVGPLNNFSLTN